MSAAIQTGCGPLGYAVATNIAPEVVGMTPAQVKTKFKSQGITFTQWAKDNGYSVNKVHRVMAGIEKGNYGMAHEIAVKLGLHPTQNKPSN